MTRKIQISCFLSSLLFLLAVCSQSLHQIEHLQYHQTIKEAPHDFDSCSHDGHYTETNHCKFCDLTLSNSTELTFVNFESQLIIGFHSEIISNGQETVYLSNYVCHKSLRAPPHFA